MKIAVIPARGLLTCPCIRKVLAHSFCHATWYGIMIVRGLEVGGVDV